ncbi:TPA: antitermination protein [Raoultella planticola]|uniref:antitermination protein Q n=2 Tax=Raoultella TaxID=160674 RepID=UPI0007CC2066|nr:antitermination protein [Raoultella ornithinolytica]SBL94287.1 putative late gene regulator [Raoultella ornithinolytica]
MNLESIAKYFAPKSPMLSDSPRATASDALTGTDIMAALGLVNAKCGFGFDLYLAKIGVSAPDRAMEILYESAERLSKRFNVVSDLSGDRRKRVIEILCTFAYQDYSRSAASTRVCECCSGSGFVESQVFTNKITYPWGKAPYWAKMSRAVRPSDWESWNSVRETVKVKCAPCNGKGVVSNSCRCHGKGKVLDKLESERQGVPVMKACDRCGGRGYARLKFSTVLEGVRTVADIKKTSAYEQLQPFFEALVAECHKHEAYADVVLSKVTK